MINIHVIHIAFTYNVQHVETPDKHPCVTTCCYHLVRNPGRIPLQKQQGHVCWKFSKTPLHGTRISFCGSGFKFTFNQGRGTDSKMTT